MTIFHNFSIKQILFVILIAALGLSAGSFYFQYAKGIEPCSLCILQRVLTMALIPLTLIPLLCSFRALGNRLCAALILVDSLAGAGVAARHVWLQSLPADQAPACGPGLDYLLAHFPLQEAFRMVLQGSGECATISWQFGLTMPGWVLVFFCSFVLASLIVLQRGS